MAEKEKTEEKTEKTVRKGQVLVRHLSRAEVLAIAPDAECEGYAGEPEEGLLLLARHADKGLVNQIGRADGARGREKDELKKKAAVAEER